MPADSPIFEFLHQAQMTNAVTGYCTCMAGIMPLLWTFLSKPQPMRWVFVYFCILLTGIPTVLFHANETNELLGTLDTGSNVFLTWAIQIAVAGDFMKSANKLKFITATTLVNGIAWAYMGYHTLQGNPRPVMIDMPPIFFTVEEVMLIVNAFLVTGMLFSNYSRIPVVARKTLFLVFFMFLGGLMLASAKSDAVPYRVFPLHAIWHILGAFALSSLWVFNHLRFSEPVPILPRADEK